MAYESNSSSNKQEFSVGEQLKEKEYYADLCYVQWRRHGGNRWVQTPTYVLEISAGLACHRLCVKFYLLNYLYVLTPVEN